MTCSVFMARCLVHSLQTYYLCESFPSCIFFHRCRSVRHSSVYVFYRKVYIKIPSHQTSFVHKYMSFTSNFISTYLIWKRPWIISLYIRLLQALYQNTFKANLLFISLNRAVKKWKIGNVNLKLLRSAVYILHYIKVKDHPLRRRCQCHHESKR